MHHTPSPLPQTKTEMQCLSFSPCHSSMGTSPRDIWRILAQKCQTLLVWFATFVWKWGMPLVIPSLSMIDYHIIMLPSLQLAISCCKSPIFGPWPDRQTCETTSGAGGERILQLCARSSRSIVPQNLGFVSWNVWDTLGYYSMNEVCQKNFKRLKFV